MSTAVAPPGGSSYAAAVPAARGAPPNPERSELRRKRAKANAQQLLLTVGLAGAGLFVLGILVVVAVIYSGPPKERPARAPAAHAAGKKPKGKPAGESNSTAQRGALAELKGVDLATMSIWMDASKQSGGGVKNVARILFSRAWRTGGSVRPAVIVELRVQNTSGESLTLRPWHAELQPTNSTAAIAIDDDNRPIAPASSAARSAPRQLRPNETVTEQLAFELPADHSSVRLVVPFAAFGQNGQIGFKIPAAAIQGSGISASPGGLGQQRGFGVGPAEPLLELKVDGELPVVTPPDTQGGLPEMSRPAENPDAPAEQAPKKEGGGEDDEDLGGMMNEDEKPAPEAP